MKISSKATLTDNDQALKADFSIPIIGKLERTFWNIALHPNSYAVSWACENLGPNQ